MALIELQAVSRHYRHGDIDVPALDGVTLAIEAGEFVAVVGQSGSGKSTLMNVLGCLDNPTAGTFRIDGRDAGELGADELAALRREHFGFIFQRYHLLPHLDARANAALPAVYAGRAGRERLARAEALLARLGLGARLDHRPNALSGGQQQRVSIARALMNGGRIILADEPTGALDSASGAEMLALLRELNAAGHTIILVTHDAAVAAHARRVIELRDGRVLKDSGTPPGHAPAAPAEAAASAATPPGHGASGRAVLRSLVQWREAVATALLALRGNRLRTALSMLGISIGIASVVTILALTTAAREAIESEMRGFYAGRIPVWRGHPALPPGTVPQPFRPAEVDAIRALPGVKAVSVERDMQLTARHAARDAAVQAVGTEAQTLTVRRMRIVQGRGFTPLDQAQNAQVAVIDERAREQLFKPGQAVLGATLMLQLNLPPADSALPVQQPGATQPSGVALPVKVVGIAGPEAGGGGNYDPGIGQVLVPMATYVSKIEARADADLFRVMVDFTVPPARVREQIVHRLKALHGVEDFSTWNDEEEFQRRRNMMAAMSALFAGVGGIALLVGGVGVMNIMLVSVSERTREIGIRMAVGARQSDVRLQFLVESVVLCCLGGLAGVALSWLGAQGLNAVQQELKVQVSWGALGVAFAVSSAVGLLFGTLPARRAAALSPVDALARE